MKLARGLGWFSIGLGLTELLAPRALSRFLGMKKANGVLRAFGLREIAAGAGILSRARTAPWVWSRVGGDLMDLAGLGRTMTRSRKKANVGIALGSVAAATALDALTARRLSASNPL